MSAASVRQIAVVIPSLIVGSLMTLSLSVHPVEAGDLTREYTNCIDRTQSNPEWAGCGSEEIARQEARLKSAWKKALALFNDNDPTEHDAKLTLIDEEKLWIKWKDAACKFYYPSRTGDSSQGWAGREGEVLHAPSCTATIISQRATFLADLVKDRQ